MRDLLMRFPEKGAVLNNLMNRVVDAVGLEGTEDEHRESGRRLSSIGYDATMGKALEGLAARPAG